MEKIEKIEEFLKKLTEEHEQKGAFFIVCGSCGASDTLDEDGDIIEQELDGVYSDYTGHLWDNVNIKCKNCGNAISFKK